MKNRSKKTKQKNNKGVKKNGNKKYRDHNTKQG